MSTAEKLSPLLNTVRLLDAVLCVNCEMISDSNGESCSVCGSKSLLSVARVLGGSAGTIRAVRLDTNIEERRSFTVLVNPEPSALPRHRRFRITRTAEKSGS